MNDIKNEITNAFNDYLTILLITTFVNLFIAFLVLFDISDIVIFIGIQSDILFITGYISNLKNYVDYLKLSKKSIITKILISLLTQPLFILILSFKSFNQIVIRIVEMMVIISVVLLLIQFIEIVNRFREK